MMIMIIPSSVYLSFDLLLLLLLLLKSILDVYL